MSSPGRQLFFCALTIVCWGLWGFFGKLALEKKMAPGTIFLGEVFISCLCAIPVAAILVRNGAAPFSYSSWNLPGLLSGLGLAVGLLSYYFALEDADIAVVVPLTATYPLISVVLGYAILGERPSAMQCCGIALVVLGAALLLAGQPSKPTSELRSSKEGHRSIPE